MHDFIQGFIKGAREAPRAYFAPAFALWRAVLSLPSMTQELMQTKNAAED